MNAPFCSSLRRGSLLRGSEACFCFFPAPRPAALPPLPLTIYTFSLLASSSPPFLPPFRLWSCFPLIEISLHSERTLEPEPHSERKRGGRPIRNTSGKQLAHSAVKAPCVSLWGQLRLLLCMCTSVWTCLLFQRCVTADSSFGYLREAPGLRKGLQRFRVFQGKSAVFPSWFCSTRTHIILWWLGCHITENWSVCFVSYCCVHFFILKQWCTSNRASLPELGQVEFVINFLFAFSFMFMGYCMIP